MTQAILPATLREEQRFRISENWKMRRLFGPKMEEVTRKREIYITGAS
jgi:hypothetical protein